MFFQEVDPLGVSTIPGMALNSSCDVLVKIVEKLRGQYLHTGRGPGPTLIQNSSMSVIEVHPTKI